MRFVGNRSSWLVAGRPGRLVVLLSAVIVGCGLAVVVWARWWPLREQLPLPTSSTAPGSRVVDVEEIPSLSSLASVWNRPLRRPFVDPADRVPAPRAKAPAKPTVPRPAVELLGVYGGRFAVFRTSGGGGLELTVAKGERIADSVVGSIGDRSVVLIRDGVSFEFSLPGNGRDGK